MAAYNRVNGVPATEHDAVLNGIVKGEWGYAGVVVSDFFATRSTAAGHQRRAGPGAAGPVRARGGSARVGAVERGEVAEDDRRRRALRRLLRLADRVGGLGSAARTGPTSPPTDPAAGRRCCGGRSPG